MNSSFFLKARKHMGQMAKNVIGDLTEAISFGIAKATYRASNSNYRLVMGSPYTKVPQEALTFDENGWSKPFEIRSQPQIPFRIKKVSFVGVPLKDILVIDIKIGRNSQLPTADPISAEFLDKIELRSETAQISQLVTTMISVQNAKPGDRILVQYLGESPIGY